MRVIAQDIGELKGVVKFHAEKIDAYVNNANKNMTIFVSTIVALAIFTIGTLVTIAIKFMKWFLRSIREKNPNMGETPHDARRIPFG